MALTRSLRAGTPAWGTPSFVVGLLLVFLGERVLPTVGWLRETLTGAGAATVLAMTLLRWRATRATAGEARSIERSMAVLSTGGTLAVLLYFSTTQPVESWLGIGAASLRARQRFEGIVTVGWVILGLGAVLPMLFAERALYPMRRAMRVEWRRVREALTAGLILTLAASYGALFTFFASELDLKADFSYFHTASPSDSTRKIAESATEPIEVVTFFPDINPVGAEVAGYVRELVRSVPNVHFEMHDRLLSPELAKQLKVGEEGTLVVQRGQEHENLTLGIDLNTARPKLKALDGDFQKLLLKVLRARRTAYFTVGHGELNDSQSLPHGEGRTGRAIRQIVEQQSYAVRDLGAANGLGQDVPADAALVAVVGPQQPFLPEEVEALRRYVSRGAHLLLCLDPEAKIPLEPLASLVGLRVSKSLLANDKIHLRRRYNDSDHSILATNRYSSHASVSTLSRIASRPVVFVGAGSLEALPPADPGLHVDFTVRALNDTFNDENGNFLFDPPAEVRQTYPLAAAVTKAAPAGTPAAAAKKSNEGTRAFVIADADVVSDAVLSNEANALLVADAVRWLGGEESFAGALSTTEDVRIEHTKQKDLVWFYGSIFGAPALVLGLGIVYTRRVRRSKKTPGPRTPEQPVSGRGVARMMARGLWVHLGLLVVSLAASLVVWTRDPQSTTAPAVATVKVWNGRPDDVQHIWFDSPAKKVSLEPRTDARGRWYFGTAESKLAPPADAGPSWSPKQVVFTSVASAQKVAEALAPFKALREIGRIDGPRSEEFGFKQPAPTIVVTIDGAEHRLSLGGTTPNGNDRYVRDEATSIVYSTHGDFLRDVELGDMGLSERDVHDFQDPDILSVRIVGGGKSREVLRRGPASKRIWADPASADKADETVSNWLNKVDRLRPTEYVADLPATRDSIARLDYAVKGQDGAFLEIAKVPGASGKSDDYVRSEHTRLWGKVYGPLAEQVEQDLPSVFVGK